jgi:PKD repeat protein
MTSAACDLPRRGLAAACALLLLCLPACDERESPGAPAAVTASLTPTPAAPVPPTTVAPSPPALLVACQAQPRGGDAPLTVQFRSFPSGGTGIYDFDWRFGDGTTSTNPHPRHTYVSRGSFSATLLVTSSGRVASCERSINVVQGSPRGPDPSPDPGASPTPSPAPTPFPDLVITIAGNLGASSYSPNPADVRVGQRVIWRNADVMTHTATGGTFDTGFIAPGASSAPITMSTAGTLPYVCTVHPGMTGTLRVTP